MTNKQFQNKMRNAFKDAYLSWESMSSNDKDVEYSWELDGDELIIFANDQEVDSFYISYPSNSTRKELYAERAFLNWCKNI